MWILNFLPDFIFHLIVLAGILGVIASFVCEFIPFVAKYKLPIQVASTIALVIGIYFEGGIANEAKWQARVKELEAKIAIAESDWKKYWGSNKTLLELKKTEPIENFKREILIMCPTKKLLTYYETQTLFVYRVLEEPDLYFNDNILGKFFRKDFDI